MCYVGNDLFVCVSLCTTANSQVPDKNVRFTDQRQLFLSLGLDRQREKMNVVERNKEKKYKENDSNVSSANRQNKEMRECVFG